jgi:UTP:GlnB (protein PII) uridylyltransferase
MSIGDIEDTIDEHEQRLRRLEQKHCDCEDMWRTMVEARGRDFDLFRMSARERQAIRRMEDNNVTPR